MTRTYSKVYRNERKSYRTQIFVALISVGACGLFVGTYFFLRSNAFRVAIFTVDGEETFTADEVRTALVEDVKANCSLCAFFGPDSILFWKEQAYADVPGLSPYVETAAISRSFFDRSVSVYVTEREKRMVWCFLGPEEDATGARTCFWMDPDGRALGEAPYMEGKAIVLVEERGERAVKPGEQILPEAEAKNFAAALRLMQDLGISSVAVTVENIAQKEFMVTTREGPAVHFSLLFDPTSLISAFKDLRSSGVWQTLRTVDARVENRLYYK